MVEFDGTRIRRVSRAGETGTEGFVQALGALEQSVRHENEATFSSRIARVSALIDAQQFKQALEFLTTWYNETMTDSRRSVLDLLFGNLNKNLGNLESAMTYYDMAITKARLARGSGRGQTMAEESTKCWDIEAAAIGNIGSILVEMGRFDSAQESLEESLTLYTRLGNSRGMANQLMILAKLHLEREDLQPAVKCIREARKLFATIGDADRSQQAEYVLEQLQGFR